MLSCGVETGGECEWWFVGQLLHKQCRLSQTIYQLQVLVGSRASARPVANEILADIRECRFVSRDQDSLLTYQTTPVAEAREGESLFAPPTNRPPRPLFDQREISYYNSTTQCFQNFVLCDHRLVTLLLLYLKQNSVVILLW